MFSRRATFQVNKCEVQMEFGFSSRSALTLSLPWGAQNSCSKRVLTLSHCLTESRSKREEITGFALEKETAHGRGGVPWLEEWFFTRTVRPEPFPGYTPGFTSRRSLFCRQLGLQGQFVPVFCSCFTIERGFNLQNASLALS